MQPFLQRLLPILVLATVPAIAAPIVPLSYSYISSPPWGYFDDTGKQLTDGLYNDLVPGSNLATPDAYNWVGFDHVDAEIKFTFNAPVTIDRVTLSMAHWTAAGVYLPSQVSIGGTLFSVDAADYPNLDKAILTFNGSWTGDTLALGVQRGGQWTFFDEVLFNTGSATSPAAVPDTASTGLCLMMAAIGSIVARRLQTARA